MSLPALPVKLLIENIVEYSPCGALCSYYSDAFKKRNCFALNCSQYDAATGEELPQANICNTLAQFKTLVNSALRMTNSHILVLFYGYNNEVSADIRKFVCDLVESERDPQISIAVITDTIDTHDHAFKSLFDRLMVSR